MTTAQIKLAIYVSAAAGLFMAGWTVNGLRWEAKVADIRLEASESALQSLITAKAMQRTMQSTIAALDAQKTKELNRAKSEINRMRESVAAGTGWLSFNANCPKLPGLTIDPGMGNGAAPRLNDSAQQSYFVLRERAELCTKQVEVLQGAVRAIQESLEAP